MAQSDSGAAGVGDHADLKKYFAEAQSWDHDRARAVHRERRMAYLVGAAGVFVAMAAIAWHIAAPLRVVEPYVIRVDRTTGAVDIMTRLSNNREITTDEAVNKYFLGQYVRAREGWLRPGSDDLFKTVAALSLPQEQEKYASQHRPENPDSPYNRYRGGEVVTATIRTISFINPRVAQLRFARTVSRPGNAPDEVSNWTATINFKYLDKPVTEADRLFNPLGFQVVSYRADPEIAP